MNENKLEHFGVKGMHWGVRKSSGQSSNTSQKSGSSKKALKIAGGVVAVAGLAVIGGRVSSNLINKNLLNKSLKTFNSMDNGQRVAVGQRMVKNLNLNVAKPKKSFELQTKELKELQDYVYGAEKQLGLGTPLPVDLYNAAKKLGLG